MRIEILGEDFERWMAATDAYAAQLMDSMSGKATQPNRLKRWALIVKSRREACTHEPAKTEGNNPVKLPR